MNGWTFTRVIKRVFVYAYGEVRIRMYVRRYPEEVADEEVGDVLGRAVDAERHQPPERLPVRRRHQLRHLRHAALRRQRRVVLRPLRQVGVAQHHLPHLHLAVAGRRRQRPRQGPRHQPAVAGAHDGQFPAFAAEAWEVRAAAGEERGDGGCLERVGARRGAGGGGAEEEEGRDHQVEVAGERAHLRAPLPRRVRPEAMDEHHHRPPPRRRRGGGGAILGREDQERGVRPEVERRAVVVDDGGAWPEAGGGEHPPEHGADERHGEPHGRRSLSRALSCVCDWTISLAPWISNRRNGFKIGFIITC